jgi:hypothetical protein
MLIYDAMLYMQVSNVYRTTHGHARHPADRQVTDIPNRGQVNSWTIDATLVYLRL